MKVLCEISKQLRALSAPLRRRAMVLLALFAAAVVVAPQAGARNRLNDKLLNRPYADQRRFNLGFSVGMNTMGMSFHHNGFVSDDGQTWFMSQPAYSPGFCVNGLVNLRLNNYFSIRVTPGIWFGNRTVKFLDTTHGTELKQDIKSAFVVVPVDLKFSAMRMRNLRPYVVGGVMPAFDVAKKRSDVLWPKTSDVYLSVGFGCDFYLPYFKFIPEVKFCFGLGNILKKDRPDLVDNPVNQTIVNSVKRATSQMIVLTFYFE